MAEAEKVYEDEDEEMQEERRMRACEAEAEGMPKLRRSSRIAEKRRRDQHAEEQQEAEEQAARGTVSLIEKEKYEGELLDDMESIDEFLIMGIQETTPPWHDDVTGEPLDNKKVREAMEKER
eukprot:4200700-Heterocapsa_arctica.AAC.1